MIQRNNHAGHGGGEGGTARKGVNALAGHSLSLGRQSQQTASTAAAAPRPEPESKRIEQLSCHFEQGRGRLAGGGEGMLGEAERWAWTLMHFCIWIMSNPFCFNETLIVSQLIF